MTLRIRPRREQQARPSVDDVDLRDTTLSAVRFRVERYGGRTDLSVAQRLVDWVTAEGADRSVRYRALIAAQTEVRPTEPVSIEAFLELCAGIERFLLGERPAAPDLATAGR